MPRRRRPSEAPLPSTLSRSRQHRSLIPAGEPGRGARQGSPRSATIHRWFRPNGTTSWCSWSSRGRREVVAILGPSRCVVLRRPASSCVVLRRHASFAVAGSRAPFRPLVRQVDAPLLPTGDPRAAANHRWFRPSGTTSVARSRRESPGVAGSRRSAVRTANVRDGSACLELSAKGRAGTPTRTVYRAGGPIGRTGRRTERADRRGALNGGRDGRTAIKQAEPASAERIRAATALVHSLPPLHSRCDG